MPPKKAASEGATLTIPAMDLREVTVHIEGVTPLLLNGWSEDAIEEMESKQFGRAKGAKPFRDAEKEWRGKLHILTTDPETYGFPSSGIKRSVVTAGGRFAGGVMTELRGLITIPAEFVQIHGDAPQPRRDVAVLRGSTPMTVYRPEFRRWALDIPFVINASLLSEEQLANLLQVAGFSVGLGAWRPERSGTFGQFRVVRVS